MEKRNDTLDLSPWIGDGLDDKSPANDADSTDQRFKKLIIALMYFKHMAPAKIRSQTFAERIEREEALRCARVFEARHGVVL
jgi:hypothetical protein